jgi:hypothetical protein
VENSSYKLPDSTYTLWDINRLIEEKDKQHHEVPIEGYESMKKHWNISLGLLITSLIIAVLASGDVLLRGKGKATLTRAFLYLVIFGLALGSVINYATNMKDNLEKVYIGNTELDLEAKLNYVGLIFSCIGMTMFALLVPIELIEIKLH